MGPRSWILVGVLTAACGGGGLWVGCPGQPAVPETPTPSTEGAGCLADLPSSFPYKPGCCEYTASVPEVTETGWDTGVLGPQPTPQHIHLGWAGPTSSTFVANWKTDN